uniref:Threonine dehydratase n=1 Tax=Albugo laibachii Nc14 TaxID=890382 RepID=F0WIH6_9STRA|nr:unnamed protein product [Albugo laibachii Nc14]|eukprot:CCA21058.1 unnamed protein product [Albugo laibachii Nc14]
MQYVRVGHRLMPRNKRIIASAVKALYGRKSSLLASRCLSQSASCPLDESDARRRSKTLSASDYRRLILEANVYDVAVQTPLHVAPSLSNELKNTILFKREDLQPVFSFKIRGAYNKMSKLSAFEKVKGVVCCSAGNHAQGVALSAKKLEISATIVMPLATPEIKLEAVKQHGQEFVHIELCGKSFDEAAQRAHEIVKEEQKTMILPFDDPLVIAGQGTIGLEVLQQVRMISCDEFPSKDNDLISPLDAIFVCCGGGGMLAGIATWIKQIRPSVRVIGVEALDAPGMTTSLAAGRRIALPHVGLFADGAAVKLVGKETFRLCEQYVDEMITVSTDEICAAIKATFQDTRVILEPAGALAVAGITQYARTKALTGYTFCAITSGANIDFTRLRFVSERADSKETLISVEIDEAPAAFQMLHGRLQKANVRVTEFSYRYADPQSRPRALIYMSFRASSSTHAERVISDMGAQYKVIDLSANELAKVHTRYLAGGKARPPTLKMREVLYRFEFPNNNDGLSKFLRSLRAEWNISLFHYRNHGADVDRILVGFQIPHADQERFQDFLHRLKCVYFEETENAIFQEFFRS